MIKNILVNLTIGSQRDVAGDYAISVATVMDAHLTGVAFAYEPVIPGTILDGVTVSIIDACRADNKRAPCRSSWTTSRQSSSPDRLGA